MLPAAQVKATEVNTGAVRIVQSNAAGASSSQVNPGTYRIEVRAAGFGVCRVAARKRLRRPDRHRQLPLSLASTSQAVEVVAQSGLMSWRTRTRRRPRSQDNQEPAQPGQDLTYVAQFARAPLMNTAGSSNDAKAAGGYGNVEFNGLPATRSYILDGYDSNDPFLGLNIGLSTNLVIGLDALQRRRSTPTRTRRSGRYGVRRSTTSQIGNQPVPRRPVRDMERISIERTDYFLHANDTPGNIAKKPRSTVNEFGVSAGGPIRANKLFSSPITKAFASLCPSWPAPPSVARLQQYVFAAVTAGRCDPVTGTMLPAEPQEVPFYQKCSGSQ